MKTGLITVFVLVLTGLVAGCGQKGTLYRDASVQGNPQANPQSNPQTNAQTETVSTDRTASDDER